MRVWSDVDLVYFFKRFVRNLSGQGHSVQRPNAQALRLPEGNL